jgi:hypothetical protein
MSPSRVQAIGLRPAEPHPQFDAVAEMHDFQRIQLRGRPDDPLAQAKPHRKLLQILRRRHHDRIGTTVIAKRHCGFFRDRATAETKIVVAPNLAIHELGWFHHELDVG